MTNIIYYCEKCDKEVETEIRRVEQEFEVKDEKVFAAITIRVCTECGEEVWDEELERVNEKIIYDLYRKKKGFLLSEEIKEIRDNIGVSQTAFARLLGFGDKTIARYENGAPQDAAHDLLLRLMRDKKNVRTAFEQRQRALSAGDCEKISEFLERELDAWTIDYEAYLIYQPNSAGLAVQNLAYGGLNRKNNKKGENVWNTTPC